MSLSRPIDRRPSLEPSARADVDPFYAMDVLREAAGRDVIHMEVGQPEGPAPEAARRAVGRALERGLGYTMALGLPELRAAIADLYKRRHGLEIDPARVILTTGSSAGFQLAFLALFEPGDRLLMAEPGYPSYRNIARALGVTPVGAPGDWALGCQLTADAIRRAASTRSGGTREVAEDRAVEPSAPLAEGPLRGVLVASPANPTGAMLSRAALSEVIAASAAAGAAFISDEIYHGLHYGAAAASALEISDDAFVISSFSKYFAMTGWRIGWMITPERFVRPIERLAQNLYICPPHVSQVAALGALSAEAAVELEERRDAYTRSRAALLQALPSAGLPRLAPADGAFYLYADVSAHTDDSADWCARLLRETGVAATPGRDFDPARGHAYARFSFAGAPDRMAEGAQRIAAFIASLRR
ncbi:MAG: aminotransferase class I/II-fold pyridoxal phosphate-dependent enzyme [Pseudomonadota bacterium]